jgi:hypothetical protein
MEYGGVLGLFKKKMKNADTFRIDLETKAGE